ncbi:hypothetical protein, partial [Mycobacterium tuberculosis]|uniref:hypothetical protein n=1 Tax=Mycobacterium tuberculosis TaxID=1773 RepID=UPI00125CB3D2
MSANGAAASDLAIDGIFDQVESRFVAAWEDDAGLMTYGELSSVGEIGGLGLHPKNVGKRCRGQRFGDR